MQLKSLMSAAGILFVTGCTSLGMGESEYACDAVGGGVSCMSAAEVYALTEQPGPVTKERVAESKQAQQAQNASSGESASGQNGAWRKSSDDRARRTGQPAGQKLPTADDPLPLRTPSKVMRVWVAPWEAENGDLNVTGLVYTEIEERQWNVGVPETSSGASLRPLQRRQMQSGSGVGDMSVEQGSE